MNQKPESRLSGEKNKKKRKLRKQKQINKNTIVQGSINNLRYAGNITLMAKKRRETKDPLHEGEREDSKSCLKTQHFKNKDDGIHSYHFMAKRWGKYGNSGIFYFLGLHITAEGDCSMKLKDTCSLEEKL